MKQSAFINWSTGKDAAYALFTLQKTHEVNVERLLTTVNRHFKRVSMHGISEDLLRRQARCIGLPLDVIYFDEQITMQEYEELISEQLRSYQEIGINNSVYGDILLEDLKEFREEQLSVLEMQGVFPLWQRNTKELLLEMIGSGLKTIVVCVNERYLGKEFLGRVIDQQFLEDLPPGVDPCGEYGEFHTFAFDGPMFHTPVDFQKGEMVYRTYEAPKDVDGVSDAQVTYGFWFLNLL